VLVQDISGERRLPAQTPPVSPPLSAGRNIRNRNWLGVETSCLSILVLLCGCTVRPTAADPVPPVPPPDPEPITSVAPGASVESATPIIFHGKSSHKRTPHRVHKAKPPETKPAEMVTAIEPSILIGKEPSAVEKLLGGPADITQKDVSLIWTYGSPDCAFQVFFYPDIKTSMFHALQYAATGHDREKIDVAQGCIQRLLIVRK